MENKNFRWTFGNFSEFDFNKMFSEHFFLGDNAWRILFFPKWTHASSMLGVAFAGDNDNFPEGFSISADFKFIIINQVNAEESSITEAKWEFCPTMTCWNWKLLEDLCDPKIRYMMNCTFVVQVEMSITQSTVLADNPFPMKISPCSSGKLVDFSSYKIDKVFIPLLERVFSKHPSLIDIHNKRSPEYIHQAYTALGRVLYFLNTTRKKDMDDEAYHRLQTLWEEVKIFQMDLTWLRPRVQYALDMKSHVEKVTLVKKKKEKVAYLQMEIGSTQNKVAELQQKLEATRSILIKAKEDFKIDLDSELGYGF